MRSKRQLREVQTLLGKRVIMREWKCDIGPYTLHYTRRSSKSTMGRFGGGWQWNIGAQWGRTTLIINLLVASVRITKRKAS